VIERNKQFTAAPYSGFVNPVLEPVLDVDGNIVDITVNQPKDFEQQMLFYATNYGFLNTENN
jgi:dipeptidyl-peptidase-3